MITSCPVTGTKYFGGHSDLLCGIIIVRTEAEREQVFVIEFPNQLKPISSALARPCVHGEYDGILGILAFITIPSNDASAHPKAIGKWHGNRTVA